MGHQTNRSNRSGHMYINNITPEMTNANGFLLYIYTLQSQYFTSNASAHIHRLHCFCWACDFVDPTYQVPSWEMALQEIPCPNLLVGDVWKPYAKKTGVCLLAFTHDLSWTHPAHQLSVLDLCQELESSSTLSAWTFQTILRQTQHQCLITQFATSVMWAIYKWRQPLLQAQSFLSSWCQ